MMKTKSLSFLFLLVSSICFAQGTYPLHPSVGDTIESIEKLDYSLFAFIPNTGFEYGTVSFEENGFYLNVINLDSAIKYPLSKERIIEAQQNIEKINAYYRLMANAIEEKQTTDYKTDRPSGKDPVLYNKAMNDQINKEARMLLRLQEDSRRMQNNPGNILPNQLIFDFR